MMSVAIFSMPANSTNPVIRIVQENPTYGAWLKIGIFLGGLTCIALLAAGIGLLRLKPWGRVLSIAYAIFAIVYGIAGTAMNMVFVTQPLIHEAQQQSGPESAAAIGGAIGGSIGGCFGLIYPILLLIFMTRPKIVAAFQKTTTV